MEENHVRQRCGLFLIGGSAGSLEFLFKLLPRLKADLPFPIVLVLHRRNSTDSSLSDLLATKSLNKTVEVEDKDPILPGHIYLAPADYHLLIEKDRTFSLDYSEKINFSRPSIDVTFESAAEIYGHATVGAILSGANEDGTQGLIAIKRAAGQTIAQHPDTAQMPFMPQHAIAAGTVGHILDVAGMADFINKLE
jgi:two-component system chemotaxis response regulator CheB